MNEPVPMNMLAGEGALPLVPVWNGVGVEVGRERI